MNIYYTKTALYAYPHIESLMGQIDDLVLSKALYSMGDYSPCEEQCQKIVKLTGQKVALIELQQMIDKALSILSDYELDCLDYKYFKIQPKEYFDSIGFDYESRKYFRKQNSLVKKVAIKLEKVGMTDEWFVKKCLDTDFFNELLKRVILYDRQNKSRARKTDTVQEKSQQIHTVTLEETQLKKGA